MRPSTSTSSCSTSNSGEKRDQRVAARCVVVDHRVRHAGKRDEPFDGGAAGGFDRATLVERYHRIGGAVQDDRRRAHAADLVNEIRSVPVSYTHLRAHETGRNL